MKYRWLRRTDGGTVYVFALGWGQEPGAVPEEAIPPGAGALVLYAWHGEGDLPDLSGYPVKKLIAWSFGVWSGARLGVAWDAALAVNGTLTPVDETGGIAPALFRATLERWTPKVTAAKFWRRMGAPAGPARDDADLLAELRWFDAALAAGPAAVNCYGRAWIGAGDRIFPAAVQRSAWEKCGVGTREREMPHWCGAEVWREAARD